MFERLDIQHSHTAMLLQAQEVRTALSIPLSITLVH